MLKDWITTIQNSYDAVDSICTPCIRAVQAHLINIVWVLWSDQNDFHTSQRFSKTIIPETTENTKCMSLDTKIIFVLFVVQESPA